MDIEKLTRDFQRDGCVLIPNYLSPCELEELSQHTERFLAIGDVKKELTERKQFQGTFKNLQLKDPYFEELLERGRQREIISTLLNDELESATCAYFDRIPGETVGIKPHYDAVHHRRMGATMWVAIDKADRDNGCLYYSKRSHTKKFENKIGLEGFGTTDETTLAVELNPGDAAIHSSLTVHWSEANRTTRSRRAISMFYWAKNSKGDLAKFKRTGQKRELART